MGVTEWQAVAPKSVPLTKAMIESQASQFRSFERLLNLEFGGTTKSSRYELIFSRLVKPDPFRVFGVDVEPDVPLMLGTDQRDYLVPPLADSLAALPEGALVLDVGAGDGQTTVYALRDRHEPLSLVPLDPSQGLLDRYQDLLSTTFPHVSIARTIPLGIDEVVATPADSAAALHEDFDMILVVHAMYFTKDPANLLRFCHRHLTPEGRIVIVFAIDQGWYSGEMAEGFRERFGGGLGAGVHGSRRLLDQFFGLQGTTTEGHTVEATLDNRLGDHMFRVTSVLNQPTRLFAHDLGDLIACAFVTELGADAESLEPHIRYVGDRLRQEPETFDLRLTLSGPRARMLSVAQPQVLIELQKV